jgi:DNA-binding MarR family transcriptional regulator
VFRQRFAEVKDRLPQARQFDLRTVRYTPRMATAHSLDRDVLTLAWLARVLEGARTELTLPQYRLLALMVDGEERASHLAGQLELAKPTVSATIDTLVEHGLVERASVEGDRRAVRLTITPTGRKAFQATEASMRSRLDDVLRNVDDLVLVEQALGQLTAALEISRKEWLAKTRDQDRLRREVVAP